MRPEPAEKQQKHEHSGAHRRQLVPAPQIGGEAEG
jgi:hypothetical protein